MGKYQQEEHSFNQNQNDNQLHFNLPALETLNIQDAPMINDICAKNYDLMLSSLKYFYVGNCGIKSFTDHNMVNLRTTQVIGMCWQTLESLLVRNFKIEEIFNLTHVDVEKNGDGCEPLTSRLQQLVLQDLSELVNICLGPKCIMCFHNLQKLKITACKKLKVIFSASLVRSLPMLKELRISNCEELVHIVEEDYETHVGDHFHHEPCFPNLEHVFVKECDKLKYLFSISINDILPKLCYLEIRQAYELKHVLIKRSEMEDMGMNKVLPQLRYLIFEKLPNLVSVCHGIDFQILKDSHWTDVQDCSHFSFYETSSTQHQIGSETADSEVEEKAEEEPSSHLNTKQSLNMGEATQQSLTKDELVDREVKKETNVIELKSQEEMARHDIQFHEEEEEEKEGGLITTQRLRSDIKAKISLLKEKSETPIHGDSNVPFIMPILSEQTSKAILPLSPISSKVSIGLDQTPQVILYKPTTDDDIQVSDKSHATVISNVASTPHASTLHKGVNEKVIKETNVTQDESKANSSEHVVEARAKEDESDQLSTTSFEGVFNVDIKEANSSENKRVEPSNLTQREQESSFSKDSQPRREMPTTPSITISQDESSKIVEVRAEDGASILETPHPSSLISKKEHILVSPNPTIIPRSPRTTTKNLQKEEEGGSMTTHRPQSDTKAMSSLPIGKEHKTSNHGEPFVPPMPIISSNQQQASNTILSMSPIPSKTLTSLKQIPMSTPSKSTYRRNNVQENVGTTNQPSLETLDAIQISSQLAECNSLDMASSICDINNALSVAGVKEIVDMMKLEGDEPSLLAEAFKTNPQLHLSSEDRSTKLLCYSYGVLLNILNILATKSPFTITEVDKTLLVEYLKDASFLGFDKDWLESIRIKVFNNCDVLELHGVQDFLKGLGNKLQANKIELANIRDQEAKAAQLVEMTQKELEATQKQLEAAQSHFNVAQQDHANIRLRHSQLLEECQEILEQRDQCSEIIATKLRPFGI